MKIPTLISAASILLLASCGSSRKTTTDDPAHDNWQRLPLTIDGNDNDWVKPLPLSLSSEKISYSVTNDDQYLYILLESKSQQEQQKIIQGGMTVWVNTNADKSEAGAVGIGYPLDTRVDRDRQLMEEAQPERYKNNKTISLEDRKTYALYGFSKDSTGNFDYADDNNPQGVKMRMDFTNQGDLIYEAAIPLQTLYPHHNPSASYAANSVAIGIYLDGLPPDANVPNGGGGGGPTVGVGGGVGFGSFGSGGGVGISISTGSLIGGNGGRKQLYKPSYNWHVVQLARGQASGVRPF
jgi:hypothetical protein